MAVLVVVVWRIRRIRDRGGGGGESFRHVRNHPPDKGRKKWSGKAGKKKKHPPEEVREAERRGVSRSLLSLPGTTCCTAPPPAAGG